MHGVIVIIKVQDAALNRIFNALEFMISNQAISQIGIFKHIAIEVVHVERKCEQTPVLSGKSAFEPYLCILDGRGWAYEIFL